MPTAAWPGPHGDPVGRGTSHQAGPALSGLCADAAVEALVIDVGHATSWRIWAWAKLVKVWASLRWSDLQAIIPAQLSLVEGRLTLTTSGTTSSRG